MTITAYDLAREHLCGVPGYSMQTGIMEMRMIIAYILQISMEQVLLIENDLTPEILNECMPLIARRKLGEPMAYIIGHKEFYSRDFQVNEHTLIPRPDTEVLIDAVLRDTRSLTRQIQILDIGTGSGCIAITLALELQRRNINVNIFGIDIDEEAIKISKKNAIIHEVDKLVKFEILDYKDLISRDMEIDIIVSNPPYIGYNEVSVMSYETVNFEPHGALFANQNGLEHYYGIVKLAIQSLRVGGMVYVEIGSTMEDAVRQIFVKEYDAVYALRYHRSYKDIQNHTRCLAFRKISTTLRIW